MSDSTTRDVIIIGGGAIGLAIAWRTANLGLSVTVCDDQPGKGASWAAAGMLAPVTEVHYGEQSLLELNLESARRWPTFANELEAASEIDLALRTDGTLAVAHDDDDLRALDELGRFQAELGLAVQRLRSRDCRALEPTLHPRVRGGLLVRGDHQVDNRRLLTALLRATERAGVEMLRDRVVEIECGDGAATGVRLEHGECLAAHAIVVAAGCSSAAVGLPNELLRLPVRPVKGQIARLRARPGTTVPTRTVRGLAHGWPVYVLPRAPSQDGVEVVVGATVEEQGFDTSVTAGAIHELLRAAIDLVPAIAEMELVETMARLRPGTPDNAPILGGTPLPGLVLATGHYRNGILLTPVTADAISALLADGTLPPVADAFTLARFTPAQPTASFAS